MDIHSLVIYSLCIYADLCLFDHFLQNMCDVLSDFYMGYIDCVYDLW